LRWGVVELFVLPKPAAAKTSVRIASSDLKMLSPTFCCMPKYKISENSRLLEGASDLRGYEGLAPTLQRADQN
jgi:hypothetical protein